IFTKTMNYACKKYSDLIVASNEEIKITFNDLKNHKFDISENIGELVVKNKSISFQDMQSVQRAFEKYFGIQLERDEYTNDIIFALASRHIIVHKSAVVDSKFEQQIKDANNRDIKVKLELDQKIQFETSEVEMVQNSMNIYINNLINKINDKISVMEIDAISID
ncbi:MAG: hypothetical protein KAS62_04880, partial [Candidatus Delongbacteria bacterium]|nr:hypothetical protein [Candidatus Delongbacteria bacterium]